MVRVSYHLGKVKVSAHLVADGAFPCAALDFEEGGSCVTFFADDFDSLRTVADAITAALQDPTIHGGKTNAKPGATDAKAGEDNIIDSSRSPGDEPPDDTTGGLPESDGRSAKSA